MADIKKGSLFSQLTRLFRSGPSVRRKVKNFDPKSASSTLEIFKKAHSNVYNSTLTAYGAFDRMCLDLDTKIHVVDVKAGGILTIRELIEKYPNGEKFIVYAYDHNKKQILPAHAHHPRSSGFRSVVKVVFDDDSFLVCTPDHPCLKRNGEYEDAGKLKIGTEMMSKNSLATKFVKEIIDESSVVETGDITVDEHENFLTETIVCHNSRYSDFCEMEACVSGDTLIAVPDGFLTIKELSEKYNDGETFVVYSYDHAKKQIVPALGKNARKTITDTSYIVKFDSGKSLIASKDHRCMKRDGTYCEVQDLKAGDSMMPFYRRNLFNKDDSKGYQWIYTMNHADSTVKNGWVTEHKVIAEWVADRKLNHDEVVHHINFIKYDNKPENLQIMTEAAHKKYHAEILNGKKWDKEINSEWIEKFKKNHSEFMTLHNPAERHDITFAKILQVAEGCDFHLDKISKILDCSYNAISNRLSDNGFDGFTMFAKAYKKDWKNAGQDNQGKNNPRYDDSIDFQKICSVFEKNDTLDIVSKKLNTTSCKVNSRIKSEGFKNWKSFNESFDNHKVVSVEEYEMIDLYDLTVDGYKNFATDSIVIHNTPEICSALDIVSEEVSPCDDRGKVLHIQSDNTKIQEILEELFYDVLNVDFNLVMWTRNLVKYGDFFLFNDISPEYGIINVYPIPISEIEREEGFDKDDPSAVRFRWITQGNKSLENWQVSHFRLLGNDAFLPYGSSILESARRIWRQLILMEDAMLVYRVIRAPERRVFYIDVGNVPPDQVANYMEQSQTSLKRQPVIDRNTGKMDLRFNPYTQEEDYFLPVRGGESGTKIDTLAGGVNAAAIEDVEYIQKKLFAALKIPKAYLGYDEDIGCLTGDTRIPLLDGRVLTIEELVNEFNADVQNWVYSFDNFGSPKAGKINKAWLSKKTKQLYTITLDNNEKIKCTNNHPFMLKNGTYKRADELVCGESLMALYKSVSSKENGDFANGYEKIFNHQNRDFEYTHRIVSKTTDVEVDDSCNNENYTIVHHKSFDKKNNNPQQLLIMGKKAHALYHAKLSTNLTSIESRNKLKETMKTEKYKNSHLNGVTKAWNNSNSKNRRQKLIDNNKRLNKISLMQTKLKNLIENGIVSRKKDKNPMWKTRPNIGLMINSINDNCYTKEKIAKFLNTSCQAIDDVLLQNDYTWETFINKFDKSRKGRAIIDFDLNEAATIANNCKTKRDFYSKIKISRTGFENFLLKKQILPQKWFESNLSIMNHKITNIEIEQFEEDINVYDLEIENWSNFALDVGIVVHNSKATLAQEDIRFSRTIQHIQKTVISELEKIAMIHLYCHGFDPEDISDFTIRLTNPSSVAQLQKLELIKTKFEIAASTPEGIVDRNYIRKNVIGLTDDEIEQIKKGRIDDKIEDAMVEKADDELEQQNAGATDPAVTDMGDEPEAAGSPGASIGDTGSEENIFAGDRPKGELLTSKSPDKEKNDDDEYDEEYDEPLDLSMDDDDAPEKAEKKFNIWGGPIKANRKITNGRAATHMPDFFKMTSIGSSARNQDSMNKPYGDLGESATGGYERKRVSNSLEKLFQNMSNSISINRGKNLLSEQKLDETYEDDNDEA